MSKIKWLNENSIAFLKKGYLGKNITPEERIKEISVMAEKILDKKGFAEKFQKYLENGWYSLASPIWSNFGLEKGLPISCFSSFIEDSMADILYTQAEVGIMSKFGGGTSGFFGNLRARGSSIKDNGYSSGAVHFMRLFESIVNVVSQGSVRRGHFAPFLPISHPDILEFLEIGKEGNPIQELTHGITVEDKWLEEMIAGDEEKREVWAKLLQRRGEIGYPYIIFIDTVNEHTVDVYKEKNLKISGSNLCSEIMLPTNENWSAVCDLSSMNLLFYDEWKNTDAVETLTYFLDAVMSDFISKVESFRDSVDKDKQKTFYFMEKAHRFAVENRSLGIGALGWHSYLQDKQIPFESLEANKLNREIFQTIQTQAYAASKQMADEYGEPEVLRGYGRRNATLTAIAPTTSSAFILGQVSQSIEPHWSNCYVKDIDKMKVTIKNPYLIKTLEKKGKDLKEVWDSIKNNNGSVQHLDFLSQKEKEVYKTFAEIDQVTILEQASVRQKFIDQSQSLNVMINPKTSAKDINAFYLKAWRLKIKSLYYQHSQNAAQELNRKKLCQSCEI